MEDSTKNNLLDDDILIHIMEWPANFIYNIPHRIVCVLSFIYLIINLLAACYLLANLRDPAAVRQYFLTAFGVLFPLFSYILLYSKKQEFHDIRDDIFLNLPPYCSLGLKNYKIIKAKARIGQVAIVVVSVILFTATTVFLPWFGDEADIFFPIMFWTKYGGNFATIMHTFTFLQYYHYQIIIVVNSCFSTYMQMHLTFQVNLLNITIDKLSECSNLARNYEDFQDMVNKRLVNCVKHHQIILEYARRLNIFYYFPIAFYTLSGVLVGVGIALHFFNIQKLPFIVLVGIISYGCGAASVTVIFGLIGQLLENEADETFTKLIYSDWYLWNSRNRSILQLMLISSSKNIHLSTSGLITLHYRLFIQIFKSIYSTITFFINVNN